MANPTATGGPGHTPGVAFTTTNSPDRKRWKWELAIRFMLANSNAKQTEVAAHIGVDPVTLSIWQQDPEFTNLKNQIITGILTHVDADLAEDIKTQRLSLKRLVPVALQNLAALALQNSNPNIKLKASQEILDREGNFAKVTRIGLPTDAQGGVAAQADNEVAMKLAEALQIAQAAKQASIPKEPPTIDSAPSTDKVQ